MKLKTSVFVSALFVVSQAGFAESKLVIAKADGTTINAPIQQITQITFGEGEMTVQSTDGSQTFSISDLVELTFDAKQNGADNATADLGDVKAGLSGGFLTATTNGPISLTVYSLQGRQIVTATGQSEVSVDMNPMDKGVYIVRINNKTIKVIR